MGKMVKAIERGYYGSQRRRVGDVFELKDGDRMGLWMGEADAPTPKKKDPMPFTSKIAGTDAGGNIYKQTGGTRHWEEPLGESKTEKADPAPAKKKSNKKTGKSRK